MQGPEDTSAGHQRPPVVGDRDEDRDHGCMQLSEGRSREAVVDDTGVGFGFRRLLLHVFRRRPEVCGAGPCVAGADGARLEDVRPQRVSDHCIHDFAGHLAQTYSGHSGTFLRLVLPGFGPGSHLRGSAVPDPLGEGENRRKMIIFVPINQLQDN